MNCRFCHQPTQLIYQHLHDYYFHSGEVSDYWKCNRCGVIQTPYHEGKLNKAYQNYYTTKVDVLKSRNRKLRNKLFHLVKKISATTKIDFIEKHRPFLFAPRYSATTKSKTKMLDFGYGSGEKLLFLSRFFSECHGYDMFPQNMSTLLENGIILHSKINTIPYDFDYIILDNVIEHVENPIILIDQLLQRLKPNACLILVTPNLDSILHQIYGKHWRGLESPRHINIFSRDYITHKYQNMNVQVFNNWRADKYVISQANKIGKKMKIHQKFIYYMRRFIGGCSSEMVIKIIK